MLSRLFWGTFGILLMVLGMFIVVMDCQSLTEGYANKVILTFLRM